MPRPSAADDHSMDDGLLHLLYIGAIAVLGVEGEPRGLHGGVCSLYQLENGESNGSILPSGEGSSKYRL